MRFQLPTALFLSSALFLVGTSAGIAQDQKRNDVSEQLRETVGELESKRTREKTIKLDMAELRRERERINSRLLDTAGRIQESEARMTAIEARLGELEAQEKIVRGSLAQRHGQISKLLGSLQRMGRNPPPVMITRRKDALAMVRSAMLLASAFPGLRSQAEALVSRLNDLVRVMTDIRREGDRLKTEAKRHSEAQTRLSGLMSAKKQSLAERQSELLDVRRAAAAIAKRVEDINELIAQIDEKVKESTALARYNAELAPKPPEPETAPPPTKLAEKPPGPGVLPDGGRVLKPTTPSGKPGSTVSPPGTANPRVAILAPPKSGFEAASPGRITPAIEFSSARGKLPLPTSGGKVLAFGDKTKYGAASKGIVLQTRHSAQITSPCDGWVVYAGEFRSYGQLLIINAGGGYHVLLAGLSQIDAQPGDFVLAKAPVGTMRQSLTPGKRTTPDKGPVLYVEFRKDGKPINPDPWWVQKVQG